MTLKLMADNNVSISAAEDGAMYNTFAHGIDYIVSRVSSRMQVNYSSSSLGVSLTAGEAVVCGRHVVNTSTLSLTLSANTSGYVVLRVDSSVTPNTVSFMSVSSPQESTDINASSTQHDFVLGQYTTNASGVSSYVVKATHRDGVFTTPNGNSLKNGLGSIRQPLYLQADGVFAEANKILNVALETQTGGSPVAPTSSGESGDIRVIKWNTRVLVYRCTGGTSWTLFCELTAVS